VSKIRNPQFPTCTDQKVILSNLKRTLCGSCVASEDANDNGVRGPDALRPGVVLFPWVTLSQNNGDFIPIACISTQENIQSQIGACWVSIDGLDRVSWWLRQIEAVGQSDIGTPPNFIFEIRPSTAGVSDLGLSGITNFLSFDDGALLGQVSGILCSQWELWGRIDPMAPAGSKLRVLVAGAADRLGGGVFSTHFGLLSIAFP